ncbi:MAG: ParB/RepB/Spo0J family partition protein [Erythrobacter sp.]|uniref:ParB/RepB/Spo0J family partition protein n=1 Tax=Erythrobacter sp. TaxID=1042 RepID=UPI0032EF2B8B
MGETRREEPLVQSEAEVAETSSAPAGDSPLKMVSTAAISPLPGNPRKHFDEAALDELAASIAARGVIQPVIVRPHGTTGYQLVAGERRWRAAQKARVHEIPALVRELDDREVMALALIENLQREDLNPVEEARAYQRLADEEGMTQADIARMVEKSRSHVANLQRLLNLPQKVLDLVESGRLSMGHARALIGQEGAGRFAQQAVDENLSVREIEKLVRNAARAATEERAEKQGSGPGAPREGEADIEAVQRHLEEFLGLPVRIKADADPRKGAVTIRYSSLDQLDLVCQRLTGGDF